MTASGRDHLFGYSVRLARITEADEGGWLAEVLELPGCVSDGETPGDALNNAREAIECWLAAANEDGDTPPGPRHHEDTEYSGKFTLRRPKSLHRALSKQSEREGASLNQLVLSMICLAFGVGWGRLDQHGDRPTCAASKEVHTDSK